MYIKLALCLCIGLLTLSQGRNPWSFTSPLQAWQDHFQSSDEDPSDILASNQQKDDQHSKEDGEQEDVFIVYAEPDEDEEFYVGDHDDRKKRAIDFKKAWKTMLDSFPPTVHKVIHNAEIRYDAEMKNLKPLQYVAPPGYIGQDSMYSSPMYQTQFSQEGQAEKILHKRSANGESELRKRAADNVQTFNPAKLREILSSDKVTKGATHFSKVKDGDRRTVTIHDGGDSQRRRRAADEVPTFDPVHLRRILGKGPLTGGATHFSQVTDRGVPGKTVDIRDQAQPTPQRRRRATEEVPTFNPSKLRQVLGLSPLTGGATHFSKVENRGIPAKTVDIRDNSQPHPERRKRATADVPIFDPAQLRQILGKEPFTQGATHFSQVEDRGVPAHTVDIREESQASPERRRRATDEVPTFDPTQLRKILGKDPLTEGATHFEEVLNRADSFRTVDIRDDRQRRRRAAGDVPTFNPSHLRQILGISPPTGGATHFSEVHNAKSAKTVNIVEDGQARTKVEESRFSSEPTSETGGKRVFRRSTKELMDDYGVKKALENLDIAGEILETSGNSEEAISKMLDAEKVLDSALHEVLGNVHDNDLSDLGMIDKMMKSVENHHSVEDDLKKVMKDTVENMSEMNKKIEEDDIEKALQVLTSTESQIDKILNNVLPSAEIEKISHSRRKRSHGVGYYDPQFHWLVSELDLGEKDQKALYRLAQLEIEENGQSPHPSSSTSLSYVKPKYKKHKKYIKKTSDPVVNTSTYTESQPKYYSPSYFKDQTDSAPKYTTTGHYGKPAANSQNGNSHRYTHQYQSTGAGISDYLQTSAHTLQSPLQKLFDSIRPLQEAIPDEMEAAIHGAYEVGKHVTSRVRPIVSTGYNRLAYKYIPQARKTVHYAVDNVPDDIKDFARQGKKIVETRAQYASTLAKPTLNKLQDDLKILQAQIKQVAEETSEYTNKEVVPNIGPMLRGLIFDAQETLELANAIVQEDVKPLVKQVLQQTNADVLQPATAKVNEYVLKPVTDSVVDYVKEPILKTRPMIDENIKPAIHNYVVPAYHSAKGIASSAVSGVNTVAQSSKDIYKDSLQPNLNKLAASTQKVLSEKVKPAVKVAASGVAETIRSEIVPPLKESIQKTLHSVFTGVPFLVKKMSYEAHDAAKVFSGKYADALKKIKAEAERKKQEKEAELNMVRVDNEEAVKKKLQGEDLTVENNEETTELDDSEATVEGEHDNEETDEEGEANLQQESTTALPSEHTPTQKPKVNLKTSTEL